MDSDTIWRHADSERSALADILDEVDPDNELCPRQTLRLKFEAVLEAPVFKCLIPTMM